MCLEVGGTSTWLLWQMDFANAFLMLFQASGMCSFSVAACLLKPFFPMFWGPFLFYFPTLPLFSFVGFFWAGSKYPRFKQMTQIRAGWISNLGFYWLIDLFTIALSDLFFTCTFREKAKYTCRIYIPSFFECQSKIQHYLCPRKFHRKRPWTISPSYPTMNAVLCTIQSYLFQYRSLCEPLKYAVRLNSLSSLMLPASHSSFLGEHESTFADHPHLNS